MNITINDILKLRPCNLGIEELYDLVGDSYDRDKYLDINLLVSKISLYNISWILEELHEKEILIKLAIFSAEQVLHIYEASHDSTAPRLAIEAAKAYINEPTEANRIACIKEAKASYTPAIAPAVARDAAYSASYAASASYVSAPYDNAYATAAYAYAVTADKNVESKIREYLIQLLKEES
jgi:hypothetical protein